MFCSKCGTQIPDGSAFCPNCGNAMEPASPSVNPSGGYAAAPAAAYAVPKAAKKKSSGKVIGLIAGVVALAAVAVVAVVLLAGKPYIKPVDKMFKALNKNDYNLLSEATTAEVYDDLSYSIEDALEYGEIIKYEHSVLDSRKLEGEELSWAQEDYGGEAFYAVTITLSMTEQSTGENYTDSLCLLVGKFGGKWKVCSTYYY